MRLELYVLDGGALDVDASVFVPTLPRGQRARVPIPMYAIRHGDDWVLVDTGCRPEVVRDPEKAWGGLARAMRPDVTEGNLAPAQLALLGLRPEDVRLVVNTHWHMDHAGGNRFFPTTPILVHARERPFAERPEAEGQGYFRAEWDVAVPYETFAEDQRDLFGDGTVVLRRTGGHTPGHLAVELRLPETGRVILAVDVVPFAADLAGLVPRNSYDRAETLDACAWLTAARDGGATVIFGHDPELFATLRKPPLGYA